MRDVNRLYGFYDELMKIHMTHFLDWRFGQLIYNFVYWLKEYKKVDDIFYIEEVAMLRYINEFAERREDTKGY